ncbi:MAG TPA: DUF1697 domain-containing protein [Acidimicrobiia bacterium]
MSAKQYVALLRGINVGGQNAVSMSELRDAFEGHGFADVRTFLNSGNVVFSGGSSPSDLEDEIEEMLEAHLGRPIVVVVRSRRQMQNIVRKAPDGFGQQPDLYHSDVIFLKPPLTVGEAMEQVELREGVDQAWPGTGVIYFARLSARRTESRMNRMMSGPIYQLMTIRSWSTTTKLLDLLENG